MKKLSILLALLIFCGESVLADPLEIELNVKQGEKPVEPVEPADTDSDNDTDTDLDSDTDVEPEV